MIKDSFNRAHNYLRISLTDNCNMRCFYCMPEEDYDFTPPSKLMQAGEISAIAGIFVKLGVNKIRLTGGEPLVRKDAGEIIRSLSKLPVKLTMTTNGSRVHEFIDLFRETGVRSINISLDTLDRERFRAITRRDQFDLVFGNIQKLLEQSLHVKVNMVVMRGINDDEVLKFIEWTKQTPVHVRFIEFMPFTGNRWSSDKVFTWQEMLRLIDTEYSYIRLKDEGNDTAKKYMIPGHSGTFAVISTMSAPFCSTCNRMRLTADGKMKNCLFSKEETDLLTALRNGEDIEPMIHRSVGNKAEALGGQFDSHFEKLEAASIRNRSMITIGG
ncbi:MAG TPA: GTP 3',8-cyclase MoaA [Cyclobacteriaceae bacterium]|nr:GTP 3',8-cyclase MoaA [Cyclobacteriaceae bacterium]